MENNQKLNFNLTETNKEVEVIIREGAAMKLIEPKPPIKTSITGVLNAPLEYLTKRLGTGQFTQERAHIIVNREDITINLIFNEDNEYERGTVLGKLLLHPKFIEFGINTGQTWTPTDLGMFFKMNRAFFPDISINMKLVSDLMNFTASINNKIERRLKESGDRSDVFVQEVNSNLPERFILKLPIFKGMPTELLEVETFAKIDGRNVFFTLLSPSAAQTLEDIKDNAINEQLGQIKEIAQQIAIIET